MLSAIRPNTAIPAIAQPDVLNPPNLPPQPLSPETKQAIFLQLSRCEPAQLKTALITAAQEMCDFPGSLNKKVGTLQTAYKEHKDNPAMKAWMEQGFVTYFETEGHEQFQILLQAPFVAEDWKKGFLFCLATVLNIPFNEDPAVEVAIQEGKIYWRIMEGSDVIYDRQQRKGNPHPEVYLANPCRMSWNHFSIFKNSGKRRGTVAITKERFQSYFGNTLQSLDIWEELKEKGILTANNRLSDSWRILSGQYVLLDSIKSISTSEVRDIFSKRPKDVSGYIKISRMDFINCWPVGKKQRAGLIWDNLKIDGIIDAHEQVQSFMFNLLAPLTGSKIKYGVIEDVLYKIVNNEAYKEIIQTVPGTELYREERIFKTWQGTGRIVNDKKKLLSSKNSCTQLWDVGTYSELKDCRNTQEEKNKYQNKILNYDHVPSVRILEEKKNSLVASHEQTLTAYQEELKKLENCINAKVYVLQENKGIRYLTRRHDNELIADTVLQADWAAYTHLQQKMKICQERIDASKEKKGSWWAVAIPESLHRQGATYLQNLQEQQTMSENPFLRDIREYLDILETRPEVFSEVYSFSPDEYIKALGAFRYLYRSQIKPVSPLDGKYLIGTIPQTMFYNPIDRQAIDALFNTRLRNFIERREGVKQAETIQAPMP